MPSLPITPPISPIPSILRPGGPEPLSDRRLSRAVPEPIGAGPAPSFYSFVGDPAPPYSQEDASGLETLSSHRLPGQTPPGSARPLGLASVHDDANIFELSALPSTRPATSSSDSLPATYAPAILQPESIRQRQSEYLLQPDRSRSEILGIGYYAQAASSPSRNVRPSFYTRHKSLVWATLAVSGVACAGVALGVKFGLKPSSANTQTPLPSTASSAPTLSTSSIINVSSTNLVATSTSSSVAISSGTPVPLKWTTSRRLPTGTSTGSATATQQYTAASFTGWAHRTDWDCPGNFGRGICYDSGWVAYDATADGHVGAFVLWPQLTGDDRSSTYNTTVTPLPASGTQLQNLSMSAIDDGLQAPGCSKDFSSSLILNANKKEAIGTLYLNYTYAGACGDLPPPDCGCIYAVKVGLPGDYV